MHHPPCIAVVGAAGHMGFPYVKLLRKRGVSPEHIIAVDPVERPAISDLGVRQVPTLETMTGIDAAIVAVPAPLHIEIFKLLAHAGVRNVLSEKPLVMSDLELHMLDQLGLNIFTGFVINFSPAIEALRTIVDEEHLRCVQFISTWGKNWCAVDRPMGPDLHEELPHPLVAAMCMLGFGNVRAFDSVQIGGTHVPFVRPELAGQARIFGFSDDQLNDTTVGTIGVQVRDGASVPVSILSSFNMFEQRRELDVTLMRMGSVFPDLKARLSFDVADASGVGDGLKIIDARTNECRLERRFFANKLELQLKAFLDGLESGRFDQRLVDRRIAGMVVSAFDDTLV